MPVHLFTCANSVTGVRIRGISCEYDATISPLVVNLCELVRICVNFYNECVRNLCESMRIYANLREFYESVANLAIFLNFCECANLCESVANLCGPRANLCESRETIVRICANLSRIRVNCRE